MIQIGTTAPDFSLDDQNGGTQHLSRFRGKKNVLLVFYPLDWTPT